MPPDDHPRSRRKRERPRPSAWDAALKLLTRRDHAAAELRRKLMQRQYSRDEIDDTIRRLGEHGYLDDSRTAALWAEQEARKGGQGRAKALARMIAHGLDPDRARAALDDVWDESLEREHARAVLDKLQRSLDPSTRNTPAGTASLARRMASRGFAPGLIRDLLDRRPGTESDINE